LALSTSTPADAATGVSVSANLTLTFNNALDANALYNVFIAKGTDGTLVTMASGYPSIDATRKIITFDPASSLTASTAHIIAYAVVDIYGQHLTGIVNFTTA
jgi:methionine-rich copper-binding protein CopC